MLKYLRLSAEMTQYELETAAGVPRWKISLAESGAMVLTDDERKALGAALNAAPELLLRSVVPHPFTEEDHGNTAESSG